MAALTLRGVCASYLLAGSMNGPAFEAYVAHMLAPILRRGDIVVLDNLAPHRQAVICTLIEARGPTRPI